MYFKPEATETKLKRLQMKKWNQPKVNHVMEMFPSATRWWYRQIDLDRQWRHDHAMGRRM